MRLFMNTKLVSQWKISPKEAEKIGLFSDPKKIFSQLLQKDIDLFIAGKKSNSPVQVLLHRCFNLFSAEISTKRWVICENNIYFDKKAGGFWLIKNDMSFFKKYSTGSDLKNIENEINGAISDEFNKWSIPQKKQLLLLTNLENCPFKISEGRPSYYNIYIYGFQGKSQLFGADRKYLYDINNNENYINNNSDNRFITVSNSFINDYYSNKKNGFPIPFLSFDTNNISDKSLFIELLHRGFYLKGRKSNKDYQILLKIIHRNKKHVFNYFSIQANEIIAKSITQKIVNTLLRADTKRVDTSPYHKKTLEDTELGHWSLWQDELESSDFYNIELPTKLVARDPKSSINDGVVAIDFGTKSTVVVYQKDTVNIHPMRVGTGDLSKEIAAIHYENPTIMEFINRESFNTAYHAKENRPNTRWRDLTISHTAKNSMQGSESSQFNTFLDDIKQWAGDKNRKLKIVDQQGKVIDLPPFLELSADDFNPIEIYAYYLGLYINNLNNGIFMDYILSFPVTYEIPIRDKLIESFEKGLKKSLPAELGAKTIAELSVTKGASEPAAYALTALKEYGFEPENEERVFYSVFDFGGGTTDFDFGIFRNAKGPKERRFDYVIEHFGAGGDKFLGGENLLELLAFEVFKKNSKDRKSVV